MSTSTSGHGCGTRAAVALLATLASCGSQPNEPAPVDAPPPVPVVSKRIPRASALLVFWEGSLGPAMMSNADPIAAVRAAMSSAERELRSPAFAARVVALLDDTSWLGTDPAATIEESIVTEPRKDSRILEVGVVRADPIEAIRLCQAVLGAYMQRPPAEQFSRERVSVLEGCVADRKR